MAKPELRVSVEDVDGVRVIRIEGPVDHVQYYKLEEAIQTQLDKKQTTLVVDLSELSYISSAGINTLGHAVSQFENLKGKLCYVRPANTAQWHFFTTIGVDQIFPWANSLGDAIKRVSAA
jgi:anti-anti-sigma factor